MLINEELKKFIQGANGMGLGTRDKNLKPTYNRVLAAKASGNDSIKVIIAKQTAGNAIENLKDNKMISLVMAYPLTFECYQFKGTFISYHDSTSEEKIDVDNYLKKMNETVQKIGIKDGVVYTWQNDTTITIEFEVEHIFEQTPKIGTGNQLKT